MKELIALIIVVIVWATLGFSLERRDWNGGLCRWCGSPWVYFDTDSHGGRGYSCGEGHSIWISYPGICPNL